MSRARGRFAALGWLLAFTALAAGAAGPARPKRPTNAALRKAFENNARSVVEVAGPRRAGAGVVVGAGGQVLTSVDYVGLEEATVRVDGQSLRARVMMANADLKAAVVVVDAPAPARADGGTPDGGAPPPAAPSLRPPAVRLDELFQEGTELVAIERDPKGELRPRVVEVSRGRQATSPFVDVNAPLAAGTPLFDGQGRLVAMAVRRRKSSSRALPVPEVKGLLAQAAPP